MERLHTFKDCAQQLRLSALTTEIESLVNQAQDGKDSYLEFGLKLLKTELEQRQGRALEIRLKRARLPRHHRLDLYDHKADNGLSPSELKQLRELIWLDQSFNLILMGPSGVGKTFIAAGLAFDAISAGYTAIFRSMQQVVEILKLKDTTRSAKSEFRHITKAHLLVIDDMMMFPVEKEDANRLFHLVNQLHEQTSIILTTNKGPQQWAELLDDKVLASALLDRLLYHCQVIRLSGQSYRMAHRKTIFDNDPSEMNINDDK